MTGSLSSIVNRGFTLIELSICLLVIGLLSSGLLQGLSARQEIAEVQATQKQLDEIREVLIGFAIANGRLPCPAKPQLASTEALAGIEDCTLQHGVIPWASLAIQESDSWASRFTYYASNRFTGPIPEGGNASFTLDTTGNANIYDSSGKVLASDLPAVIISHGRHAAGAFNSQGIRISGANGEENENADGDLTFVAHTTTPAFDDLSNWINPSLLKARMVSAGKLP